MPNTGASEPATRSTCTIPPTSPNATVGYALCGKPVRIWRDEPFDPSAPEADPGCLDAVRGRDRESAGSPEQHDQ